MSGFTPLFSSIVTSTIWREPDEVRILWITMLALKDRHGNVEGSIPGIAAIANLSIEKTKSALKALLSPDEYSRTEVDEGRRIRVIDGGWYVINHDKFREMVYQQERKEYLKIKQREFRKRKQMSTAVNNDQQLLEGVNPPLPPPQTPPLTPPPTKAKAKAVGETLDEIIASLRPLCPHVNFEAQLNKMRAWLMIPKNKHRKLSREFITNWVNKIDAPVSDDKATQGAVGDPKYQWKL